MKVTLLVVGKTDKPWIKEAIAEYTKRLKHYVSFEIEIIPDIKKTKNLTLAVKLRNCFIVPLDRG